TIRLIDAFGREAERAAAAVRLAHHFGVEAIVLFVPDPVRPATLLPVRGLPPLPAIRGWRELLARCTVPGTYVGTVAFPDRMSDRLACAYVLDGFTCVAVGCSAPDPRVQDSFALVGHMLPAMLGAEQSLAIARGELEIERQNALRITALAQALDRARSDAERATRVKDEFLAMLGHELRNPLAPIVTALQMLRLDGVATRAQDVLERQVGHLLRLVDDLLDVSRIASGKIELRIEAVELASVVNRGLEISRPLLEQRRNKLVVDVRERGLVVDGDAARLAQVVSNLVTNAAKYSDPESTILVLGTQDEKKIRITVVDQGIGLDAKYLDRVFDQFLQVPQGLDRSAGGLGLGLAIVRNIVERHGVVVQVTSAGAGTGSTFVVELPRSLHTVGGPPSDTAPAIPTPRAAAQILVVDDNQDAAILMGEALAACGHTVAIAHSGPDALAELDRFTPQIALLDIGLPAMDGYELAERMRARLPSVKLIAVTGYGQANDRVRALEAGFHVHLVKPARLASVLESVDELLAR
ncbi:MAG: ATP-binding protein, partial [Polyangiales bacterium]